MEVRNLYPGLDATLVRRFAGHPATYVRGDVQINQENGRAKGRRLTSVEVATAFGEETLKKIDDDGASVIQARSNASSVTIIERLDALGIGVDDLADRMEIPAEKLARYLDGYEFFPIRAIERACFHLGLDDGRVSAETTRQPDPKVRLRYYDKNQDEHTFRKELVFDLAEKAWKLQKLSYLRTLIALYGANEPDDGARFKRDFIDANYKLDGRSKPTVAKGEAMASFVRSKLHLAFRKDHQVNLALVFSEVGIPAFQDSLPMDYSGMTVVNPWNDARAVVANTAGNNSTYEVMRFTLAHELAHALGDPSEEFVTLRVGDTAGASAGKSHRKEASKNYDFPEMRANAFAINFLAPGDEVKNLVAAASPWDNLEELVGKAFGISASAAGYRLGHFNLANQQQPRLRPFFTADEVEGVPSLEDELLNTSRHAADIGLIHSDTVESIRERLDIGQRQRDKEASDFWL